MTSTSRKKFFVDPDYVPTKTFTDLSEEFPEQAGLKQLSSAERMENPPPQLEGLTASYRNIISRRKR